MPDGAAAQQDEFVQCAAVTAMEVFSSYAWGDPMPHNALYIGEDGEVPKDEAITIYVRCEREAGHAGKHLNRSKWWKDSDV